MPGPSSRSPRPQTLAGVPFPSLPRPLLGGHSPAPCRPDENRGCLCAVALHVVLQLPDSSSFPCGPTQAGAVTPKANVNYRQIVTIHLENSRIRLVGQFEFSGS